VVEGHVKHSVNTFKQNKVIILAVVLVTVLGATAVVQTQIPNDASPQVAQESRGELSGEASGETFADAASQSAKTSKEEAKTEEKTEEAEESLDASSDAIAVPPAAGSVLAILKDVGEAAFGNFGLAESDFRAIKDAGFDVIEGNFDICAEDTDVMFFLDSAYAVGLRVILNAGAGEAEWGYPCDGDFDPGMVPTWQKDMVREWVVKWKSHPALYAWDTSNEDGGTFPFGTGGVDPDPDWETKYALSAEQLQEAYADVKSFDSSHPVMIRMNGWYFYDYSDNFFRPGNAFGKGVADIVMVNAYSNVDEYFKDFVSTVLRRAARSLYAIDPNVQIVPALGVWEEPPIWVKPTEGELLNDFNQALKAENLLGVAFFKYGAREGSDWYLPDARRGDAKLWQTIQELIK